MNLRIFFRKKIRIIYKDGEEITGFVETYTLAIDTEEELYDEIALINCPQYPGLNGVSEEEIKSIEIIEE